MGYSVQNIRLRPAMYIGDTGLRGLYSLFSDALDNSIHEAVSGYARQIDVVLHTDGSFSITDDGRGIPIERGDAAEPLEVARALTELDRGQTIRPGEFLLTHGDGCGGVACLNALSEWLEVTVRQNGIIYSQRFERGVPTADLARIGETSLHDTGTCLRWFPDAEIFEKTAIPVSTIRGRLRTLAFLSRGTQLTLLQEASGRREVFESENGLADYVELLNTGYLSLAEPCYFQHRQDDLHIDVAFQYRSYCPPVTLLSFANHRLTPDGGAHERGFWKALTEILSHVARSRGYLSEGAKDLSIRQVSSGLTAVLSVRIADLQLAGPTRGILSNDEVGPRVYSLVREGLERDLERGPDGWDRLLWLWRFYTSKWYYSDKTIR